MFDVLFIVLGGSRASRKVKSNDDLCNDIREFLSSVGLPEDHVPTMKELSQHGRCEFERHLCSWFSFSVFHSTLQLTLVQLKDLKLFKIFMYRGLH